MLLNGNFLEMTNSLALSSKTNQSLSYCIQLTAATSIVHAYTLSQFCPCCIVLFFTCVFISFFIFVVWVNRRWQKKRKNVSVDGTKTGRAFSHKGESFKKIALKLGVTKQTVSDWKKKRKAI